MARLARLLRSAALTAFAVGALALGYGFALAAIAIAGALVLATTVLDRSP